MAIKDLTIEEMLADRLECVKDVGWCELALVAGVTEYSGGTVEWRRDENLRLIAIIDAELQRRGYTP